MRIQKRSAKSFRNQGAGVRALSAVLMASGGCDGASTSTACVGACAAGQQRRQRQRGLETGANEKSSAGTDRVGESHHGEAFGLPLDAQSLSLWLATEHRRVLSVMLLSSLDGSAPDATRSAAKAIVRSETLEQARTLTIDRWGNRAQAPSAETLQLCIGLLRTLTELADSGDVLGGGGAGGTGSAGGGGSTRGGDGGGAGGGAGGGMPQAGFVPLPSGFLPGGFVPGASYREGGAAVGAVPGALMRPSTEAEYARQLLHSSTVVKDALAAGELPERLVALLHAPLEGPLRLQRLQLDLRSQALAAVRSLLQGPTAPPARPLLLLRALRPALVRRALFQHLIVEGLPRSSVSASSSSTSFGSSGDTYAEQLAMTLAALTTAVSELAETAPAAAALAAAKAARPTPNVAAAVEEAMSAAASAAEHAAEVIMQVNTELAEQVTAEGALTSTATSSASSPASSSSDRNGGGGGVLHWILLVLLALLTTIPAFLVWEESGRTLPHDEVILIGMICLQIAFIVHGATLRTCMRPAHVSEAEGLSMMDVMMRRVVSVPLPVACATSADGAHAAQRLWFILPPEAEWLLASPVGAAALLRFVGRAGVPRVGHGIILGTPGRHPGRTPPTAALSLPIGSAGGGSAGGGGTRGGAGRARGNGWLCCPRRVPRSHSTEVLRRLLHLRGGAVGGRAWRLVHGVAGRPSPGVRLHPRGLPL